MSAERLSKKQSKRGVKKPVDRNTGADKYAIYLREDSNEFIARYIEPELLRAFGAKTLQYIGEINIDRSMPIHGKTNQQATWYEVSVSRDIKNKVPFTVGVTITEEHKLSDEELLVQWPLLEKAELANVLKDAFYIECTELDQSDLEDFAEGNMTNALQAKLMQNEVDVLGEVDVEKDDIAKTLFGKSVLVFAQRSLVLKRRSRPRLDFTAGYRYDGDTYTVLESAVDQINNQSLDGTLHELETFMNANRQFHHQVDSQESQEFIEALKILGFQS
ncbi:MAG: hypothetical protein ABIR46_04710 [Candidatus Saccharimonadales bacterium]